MLLPEFNRYFKLVLIAMLTSAALMIQAAGQTFTSGSTGADGAFAPPAPPSGQSVEVVLPLPASGIFNFTTVTIPAGVKVTFVRNARNTPVVILATGDVRIEGSISVAGQPVPASQNGSYIYNTTNYGSLGGPGGFSGGNGAPAVYAIDDRSCDLSQLIAMPGGGPGGGGGAPIGPPINGVRKGGGGGGGGFAGAGLPGQTANQTVGGSAGERYGSPTLIPLIGGSGGGGSAAICGTGASDPRGAGSGGSGGGGAILIASSTRIILNGPDNADQPVVDARGGDVHTIFVNQGGAGAGGAVRLIANEISGQGWISARGGKMATLSNFAAGGNGGDGLIRFETTRLTFSGRTVPQSSYALPGSPDVASQPSIAILAVGGSPIPSTPFGSFQNSPDAILSGTQSIQTTISLSTTKVPVGTRIRLIIQASDGTSAAVLSEPVTGSLQTGSATATVTLPTGVSVIKASATFAKP